MAVQVLSLNAVTGTGAGTAGFWHPARRTHAMQVVLTGSPTACIVDLQGSLNGSNWFRLARWSIAAGQASGDIVFAESTPVQHTRANLDTLTGGTSPTVTANILAS